MIWVLDGDGGMSRRGKSVTLLINEIIHNFLLNQNDKLHNYAIAFISLFCLIDRFALKY